MTSMRFTLTVLFASLSATTFSQAATPSDVSSIANLATAYGKAYSKVAVSEERFALPFATIVYSGNIEGARENIQMLYRKFTFGWQLIDFADDGGGFRRCDLLTDGVPAKSAGKLIAADLPPLGKDPCRPARPFAMPSADEESVRAMMNDRRASIPSVKVVSSFAFVSWAIPGGGEALYAKRDGSWHRLTGGGGAMNACEITRYGVPLSIATQFAPIAYGVSSSARVPTTCKGDI